MSKAYLIKPEEEKIIQVNYQMNNDKKNETLYEMLDCEHIESYGIGNGNSIIIGDMVNKNALCNFWLNSFDLPKVYFSNDRIGCLYDKKANSFAWQFYGNALIVGPSNDNGTPLNCKLSKNEVRKRIIFDSDEDKFYQLGLFAGINLHYKDGKYIYDKEAEYIVNPNVYLSLEEDGLSTKMRLTRLNNKNDIFNPEIEFDFYDSALGSWPEYLDYFLKDPNQFCKRLENKLNPIG